MITLTNFSDSLTLFLVLLPAGSFSREGRDETLQVQLIPMKGRELTARAGFYCSAMQSFRLKVCAARKEEPLLESLALMNCSLIGCLLLCL